MIIGKTHVCLSNGMRVKYLDISQTCFRNFLFMVQFTFFYRVENWNTKVQLYIFQGLAILVDTPPTKLVLPFGCHQSSKAREGQKVVFILL